MKDFNIIDPNEKEVQIPCVHCKGSGYVPGLVNILTMPYDILMLCKHCGGKGFIVMYETKGDSDAS